MQIKKKPTRQNKQIDKKATPCMKNETDKICRTLRCKRPEDIGLMDLVFVDDFLTMEMSETN